MSVDDYWALWVVTTLDWLRKGDPETADRFEDEAVRTLLESRDAEKRVA